MCGERFSLKVPEREGVGGVKQGRSVILRCPLSLQRLGVPRHPDAGKNSTKSVIVTPLFVSCAPNASKN